MRHCCHSRLHSNVLAVAEKMGGKLFGNFGSETATLVVEKGEYKLRVTSAANSQLFAGLVCEDWVQVDGEQVMVKDLPTYIAANPQEYLKTSVEIAEGLRALKFLEGPERAWLEGLRANALNGLKEGYREWPQRELVYLEGPYSKAYREE